MAPQPPGGRYGMDQQGSASVGAGTAVPPVPSTVLGEFRRGWPIVLVAAVGLACGLGALPIYSLGALTKPMADDLGWSRAEVQAIFTWLTIGNLVAAPALGWWLDRHGVRAVTLWSTAGMAAGYAVIGVATQSPATAYLFAFLTAMLGVATTPISSSRREPAWSAAVRTSRRAVKPSVPGKPARESRKIASSVARAGLSLAMPARSPTCSQARSWWEKDEIVVSTPIDAMPAATSAQTSAGPPAARASTSARAAKPAWPTASQPTSRRSRTWTSAIA